MQNIVVRICLLCQGLVMAGRCFVTTHGTSQGYHISLTSTRSLATGSGYMVLGPTYD